MSSMSTTRDCCPTLFQIHYSKDLDNFGQGGTTMFANIRNVFIYQYQLNGPYISVHFGIQFRKKKVHVCVIDVGQAEKKLNKVRLLLGVACGSFLTALSREDRAVLGVHTLRGRICQHPGIEMVLYVVAHFHGWVVPEGECILHFPYSQTEKSGMTMVGRCIYTRLENQPHISELDISRRRRNHFLHSHLVVQALGHRATAAHATPRHASTYVLKRAVSLVQQERCGVHAGSFQLNQAKRCTVVFFGRVPGVVLGAGCRLVGWGVLLSGLGYLYPIYFQLCM